MHRFARSFFAALTLVLCLPCAAPAQAPSTPCRVKAEFPHDPNTFTQGLFIENGRLYESSGGYGRGGGYGHHHGHRHMFYATGRPRWARYWEPAGAVETYAEEKTFLKNQAEFLKEQLEQVNKRLTSLENDTD